MYQKEHLNKHAWWWIDGRRLTGRHKRGDSDGTSVPRLIFFLNESYWEHATNKLRRIEGDGGPVYKEDTEDQVRCRQRVAVLQMPNIPTEVQMAVGPKYSCKVQSLDGAWGLSWNSLKSIYYTSTIKVCGVWTSFARRGPATMSLHCSFYY